MTDFGLDKKIIDTILKYLEQQPEIEMVKVYGSRAIGNYKNGSDIDLAIFLKSDSANSHLIKKISLEIDELPTPYMFDITDYSSIQNENLKKHIDDYGKIFYTKNN